MQKLYKGDCLKIMQKIPEKSIDLILCDLPYGMTDCQWDDEKYFNIACNRLEERQCVC